MSEEESKRMKKFMEDQVKEMEIHKWIESEKANQDLGEEALKDWIKKHAEEYRKKWEKEHNDENIDN
jgi:hypothetical protein